LPHLPAGYYAALIGTVPIPQRQYEQLLELANNSTAHIERAVQTERTQQLQARSDITTALVEQHRLANEGLTNQLVDARDELRDREQRIRALLSERHDDVGKLAQLNERAVSAENRDLEIQAKDNHDKRQAELDALKLRLDSELMGKGLEHLSSTVPKLLVAYRATSGDASPTKPANDSAIANTDPPPLCFAVAQLAWRIRDPDLVAALGATLSVLSAHPSLQALGVALANEAPEAFAQVAAILAKMSASTPSPAGPTPPATNGHTTTNGHSPTTTADAGGSPA
jgi:hypothetical protein